MAIYLNGLIQKNTGGNKVGLRVAAVFTKVIPEWESGLILRITIILIMPAYVNYSN
jgi:hypothetical protein